MCWRSLPKRHLLLSAAGLAVIALYLIAPESTERAVVDEPIEQSIALASETVRDGGLETPPTPELVETVPVLEWKEGNFGKAKPFYYQMLAEGLPANTVHDIIDSLTPVHDFRKSRPDHRWRLGFRGETAVRFTLEQSAVDIYDIYKLDTQPQLIKKEVRTFTNTEVVHGEIHGSLIQSMADMPKSSRLATKLESIFAWDIDFHRDPREGDRFEVLVEKHYIKAGEEVIFNDYGHILAARYHGQRERFDAFRFTSENEESNYYNSKGKSLVRDFLRSPVKIQNISSSFTSRRFHPILKKYRAHNGVDYSARRNAPVMSVANGKVIRAGRYGGAGIAVEIQHKKSMMTQYFHLNKIAAGISKGTHVKQGQVIGYVGKTGLATSYHLHFGMKINGKYVNPQKQKYQPGKPLLPEQTEQFQQLVTAYLAQFEPFHGLPLVANPQYTEFIPHQTKL